MQEDTVSTEIEVREEAGRNGGVDLASPRGNDDNHNQSDQKSIVQERWTPRSCRDFDATFRIPNDARIVRHGVNQKLRNFFCARTPLELVLKYLPFISMLRHYDIKKNLGTDIVSGLSVSILHTGQGLGYAALAGLPPVNGIYVSFFHVVVYFFFGTSNHISVGCYALTSLLVGAVLDREMAPYGGTGSSLVVAMSSSSPFLNFTGTNSSSLTTQSSPSLSPSDIVQLRVGIASSMSFLVGANLTVLGLLRFGSIIANYISPVFISAFTCASAFHIASSQLKYAAFGQNHYIGSYSGPLKLYYLWRDFFINFLEINWMCSICFLVSMTVLLSIKIGINKNPKIRHKLFMPVPVDLVVIVMFTVLSYYYDFENFPTKATGVDVVGEMPIGLPTPTVPSFHNWGDYFGDAFIISILIFLFNYTMANLFKEKYKYNINENQEMLAPGLCHLFGSFFSCFPGSASPPRCFLQEAAGGKSQLSSLVSGVVLILVLYVIGPYLYHLPFAVIAALICASLKRLILQVTDVKRLWEQDKIDFVVWTVTFLSTFILDIELGMIVGIGFHVFTVALRVQLNGVYEVGEVDSVYENVKKYHFKSRDDDVLVLRYNAPILFVNCDRFRRMVLKEVQREKIFCAEKFENVHKRDVEQPAVDNRQVLLKALILDCTFVSFIDTAAAKSLLKLLSALEAENIELYISGCSPSVRKLLRNVAPVLYAAAYLSIDDVALHLLNEKKIDDDKPPK